MYELNTRVIFTKTRFRNYNQIKNVKCSKKQQNLTTNKTYSTRVKDNKNVVVKTKVKLFCVVEISI